MIHEQASTEIERIKIKSKSYGGNQSRIDITVFEQSDYTTRKVVRKPGPDTRGQIKLTQTTTARATNVQGRDALEQLLTLKTTHYDRESDNMTKMTLDAIASPNIVKTPLRPNETISSDIRNKQQQIKFDVRRSSEPVVLNGSKQQVDYDNTDAANTPPHFEPKEIDY